MESTPFSSVLTATATTTNGTMIRSSTPTVGGRSAMGLLVTELIVQRLPAGFAAGKQTSRILLRNGSEPYSRQPARARRRADRISNAFVSLHSVANGAQRAHRDISTNLSASGLPAMLWPIVRSLTSRDGSIVAKASTAGGFRTVR